MRIFSLPSLDLAQLVQSAGFFALQDYQDYIPEKSSFFLESSNNPEANNPANIETYELITSTGTAAEISKLEHSHDTLPSFEQDNSVRYFRKSVALVSATSTDDSLHGLQSFSTGLATYNSEQNPNSFSNAIGVGTHLSNVLSAATVGQAQFFNGAALETFADSLIGSQYTPWGVSAALGGESLSASSSDNSYKHAFVIDSGVSRLTDDLNLNTAWSKSWLGTDPLTDVRGHGTHVAGTIAALDNDFGVIGVAPGTQITSLQVLDQNGSGSLENVQLAIEYAVDTIFANNINLNDAVINLSLTANGVSRSLDRVIKNAADRGVRFSVAAGNFGSDVDGYSPATTGDHANVYVASAVDSNYQMASWSNWDDSRRGDDVDFAAAGVNVLSYYTDGQLAYLSGTSMAAPHLAGQLLLGDVVAGDYVLANSSGYSDPFALSVLNTNPTDPTTTLNITSSASELVEGDQIAFELLHSGSAQQTYYWSISGDVDLDDFSGLTSLNGQVDLTEGIPSELVFVTKSNDISEPIESLSFNVFSDSLYQDKILSSNVSVLDDGLSEPTGTSSPTDGDDVIIGTESDDVLTGVISSDPTPGRGEVDVITGLSGVDIFVLGDERGVFYDDGSSKSSGSSDYMLIKDFEVGTDKLQLLNDLYWITPGDAGLNLFWNSDGNSTFDARGRSKDELIAILEGVDTISNNDLILV